MLRSGIIKTSKKNSKLISKEVDGYLLFLSLKNSNYLKNEIVESLLACLREKDNYTYEHSLRVAFYCSLIADSLKLTFNEKLNLELAGLLHDIGKIGIPDNILTKPSRLSEEEFSSMKLHPVKTANILSSIKELSVIAHAAKHHHERYDGKGYPSGLKSDEIPLFSRIILISDTFDAMTSTRPYRKGLPYEVAFNELQEYSGSQFDPFLVKRFINILEQRNEEKQSIFSLSVLPGEFKKAA